MKDEIWKDIEEILDYLTRFNEEDKYSYSPEYLLDTEEIRLLYDYITNLQEENERLEENNQNMQVEMARSWQKIDKAIDYIGNPLDNYWQEESIHLLAILKGSDKE